ncbi:MAG: hypothetical protein H0X03_02695 [Nitrosopumilus sp.]|nr:hypothetical protein [Nitrosopumilus sp.]
MKNNIFLFSILVIFFPLLNSLFSSPVYSFTDNLYTITDNSKELSIRGTISSNRDVFQNTGLEQSFFILPLKDDNATYSGTFTFTSTKPVQIQSFHILGVNHSLKLPIQYGTLYTVPINGTFLIPSDLLKQPQTTGTELFSGNALRVVANEPFIITYSFSGETFLSVVNNNLSSALDVYEEIIGGKS